MLDIQMTLLYFMTPACVQWLYDVICQTIFSVISMICLTIIEGKIRNIYMLLEIERCNYHICDISDEVLL